MPLVCMEFKIFLSYQIFDDLYQEKRFDRANNSGDVIHRKLAHAFHCTAHFESSPTKTGSGPAHSVKKRPTVPKSGALIQGEWVQHQSKRYEKCYASPFLAECFLHFKDLLAIQSITVPLDEIDESRRRNPSANEPDSPAALTPSGKTH